MFQEDSTINSKKSLYPRMQPPKNAASSAAKSKTKKPNCMKKALRCLLSCFCTSVEDSDEEDDAPLDQPLRIIRWSDGTEEQAEEPPARVGRPGSPLAVAGHQSLENKHEETLSSKQRGSFLRSSEPAEAAAEQPIATSSSDEEEENSSPLSDSISDILATFFDDQSEISSRSTTCTSKEEEENLSASNKTVSDVLISPGSTDDEDPEIYFSCVSDTQQEEQAEEPLAVVGRPGSPLGVAGHQSPACPAGVGGEDTCPVDSPSSPKSSIDVEQAIKKSQRYILPMWSPEAD
ncbi:uncharacterized protein LOC130514457 [Takifugu flavidus]|uniref:uncharacterized protein LOC130514457 n=1 Tax=Takifugu flavidus TaxID=433684 RepID=UPI00254432B3|nr:uncharacterized protein LOC130514457 [Takifugu flavidus]